MSRWSFTAHPKEVGETYVQHLGVATGFGAAMIGAGLACLVHGALPFLFIRTGSSAIARLHERMVTARRRAAGPASSASASAMAGGD